MSTQNSSPSGKNRVGFEARKLAARLLGLVVDEGHSLAALCDGSNGNAAFRALISKDRAMVRAILMTALRHRGAILTVLKQVMDRPEPKRARDLTHNLHVATAQILFMELPDSAAVNLGVAAIASNRSTQRFKGFANAVLRRIGREKETLLTNVVPAAPVLPTWLRKQVRSDFGKRNLSQIEDMVRLEPCLDISLKDKSKIRAWAEKFDAQILPTSSLRISSSTPVQKLDGYRLGEWWVQNAAAAIPATLLGNVDGQKIADLCAAPGGKSAQLASAGANVTAIDNSQPRLNRLIENFERLELECEIICDDVLDWNPGKLFDAVLLDAPCSSTGTMRRHPDVLWAKREDEIKALGKLQIQMLNKAIDLAKPGGTIIYATCSIAKAEGEDVFAHILYNNENVKNIPIVGSQVGGLDEIINGQGAVRCLPHHLVREPCHIGGLDGFFVGRLQRL